MVAQQHTANRQSPGRAERSTHYSYATPAANALLLPRMRSTTSGCTAHCLGSCCMNPLSATSKVCYTPAFSTAPAATAASTSTGNDLQLLTNHAALHTATFFTKDVRTLPQLAGDAALLAAQQHAYRAAAVLAAGTLQHSSCSEPALLLRRLLLLPALLQLLQRCLLRLLSSKDGSLSLTQCSSCCALSPDVRGCSGICSSRRSRQTDDAERAGVSNTLKRMWPRWQLLASADSQ
jgi:hypothetical protein